eukprot:scaffold29388_cov78-Phaeocystis_antarctica.AAC.1
MRHFFTTDLEAKKLETIYWYNYSSPFPIPCLTVIWCLVGFISNLAPLLNYLRRRSPGPSPSPPPQAPPPPPPPPWL